MTTATATPGPDTAKRRPGPKPTKIKLRLERESGGLERVAEVLGGKLGHMKTAARVAAEPTRLCGTGIGVDNPFVRVRSEGETHDRLIHRDCARRF